MKYIKSAFEFFLCAIIIMLLFSMPVLTGVAMRIVYYSSLFVVFKVFGILFLLYLLVLELVLIGNIDEIWDRWEYRENKKGE